VRRPAHFLRIFWIDGDGSAAARFFANAEMELEPEELAGCRFFQDAGKRERRSQAASGAGCQGFNGLIEVFDLEQSGWPFLQGA